MAKTPGRKGIDSRDRTLGLYSIDDLYKKLSWEIDEFIRLSRAPESPNLPACYMAQNAASTAWHMGDWLSAELNALNMWADASKLTGQQLQGKHDLKTWMRKDTGLMACEQIADATKHAELFSWVYQKGFSTETKFIDSIFEIDAGGVVTTVHDYVENTTAVPRIVLREGEHRGIYDLEPLLERAATWWNYLLATIRYEHGKA